MFQLLCVRYDFLSLSQYAISVDMRMPVSIERESSRNLNDVF